MTQSLPAEPGAKGGSRLRSFAKVSILIVLGLVLLDLGCVLTGLLPPVYTFGIRGLGWAPEQTGAMRLDSCRDFEAGGRTSYLRNEIGIRTSYPVDAIKADTHRLKIAVVGDSHTDLCAPNDSTHPGVLEAELNRAGIPTLVLSYGMGRYSPLQAYLLYRMQLTPFRPKVLILNFYTGNDFYDMLRPDDRPHFVSAGDGYRVESPEWFVFDDPDQPRWMRTSRLVYLLRSMGRASGIGPLTTRVRYLMATAAAPDRGFLDRMRITSTYLSDLRKAFQPSLGYPAAFAAQMLNQSLFFHHFPGNRAESVRRVQYLLRMIREENPGLEIVMSPIPSYQLAVTGPLDPAYASIIAQMPFTFEQARADEQAFYDELKSASIAAGWTFVDNLESMRAYHGPGRLYNGNDYHISRAASEIIGRNEARVLEQAYLKGPRAGTAAGSKAP